MNIKEEYDQTINKIDFFQSLSNEDKINLFNSLSAKEQTDLLNILPFQYIKNFISLYPKEKQQNIYKKLSDHQLKSIYNSSTKEEQQTMIEVLETRQIMLNDRLEESRQNIQSSTNDINMANASIEQSKTNIAINKKNINEKKVELKKQKIALKKLERERKRKLKKVLASKKKLSSPLNRIGIISKYRTKKYLDRIKNLEQTNLRIDSNKMENAKILHDINELNDAIKREKQNIDEQKQRKEEAYQNINFNVSRIDRTEYQIKRLSNFEKKLLGRKLYKKTVFERDCIIVRNKKMIQEQININQPKQEQTSKIEKLNNSDVEVIESSKNNTEIMVNNIVENANKLQEIGVNFYPPANRFGGIQGSGLLSNPITQISQEQLILVLYTMTALYNYNLQQTIQQQQNLSNDYTRTLSKNSRGIVNLTLLASIMFFVIGLILFVLK